MILDTTFIIDLLNNDPNTVKKAQELDSNNSSLFRTAITVFELWQGINDIQNKEKLEKISNLDFNIIEKVENSLADTLNGC